MVNVCCEDMQNNVCIIDQKIFSSECDKTIYYSSRFDEYGIPIRDGERGCATSYILINNCPWCGKKLPESKRNAWFDALEELGFDSPLDEDIPEKFKTAEWWKGRGDGIREPY